MAAPGCLKGWGNEWRVCSLLLPTPSLLSLVHNLFRSQLPATVFLLLPWVFFLGFFGSSHKNILMALLNISHILQPTYCLPTDMHTYMPIHRCEAHRRLRARFLHYPLFNSQEEKQIFRNHKTASFFVSPLFTTIEKGWKEQRGGLSFATISCHFQFAHRPLWSIGCQELSTC